MKTPTLLLLLLLPALIGCKSSREKEQQKLREAFMAGQQSAHSQFPQHPGHPENPQPFAATPSPPITVLGEVRQNKILWRPELTLSQVLHEAGYQGIVQPRSIFVVRNGKRYQVRVTDLLKGRDNPEIIPGDVIDIQR